MYVNPNERALLAGAQIYDLLERACEAIEPTDTQYETAKSRYQSVGKWLAGSLDPLLAGVAIYVHGSFGLGTAVRPLVAAEFDVDLIAFAPSYLAGWVPSGLKRIIGSRLRENERYAPMLEEKPRCWRLNYAGEFHMDVTPAVRNPHCSNRGELVPERASDRWKPSNPKGYRIIFEARATLRPRFRFDKAIAADSTRAQVAAFPEQSERKGMLRRAVQICKRHRDVFFESRRPELTPISIVTTTLASRAYGHCVQNFEYDGPLDLLIDVVTLMPEFIDGIPGRAGCVGWAIWNESTDGENFAEKWNAQPELAAAFFDWRRKILDDLAELKAGGGLDQVGRLLKRAFGERVGSAAINSMTDEISSARLAKRLSVSPSAGLVAGTARANTTAVPSNTFHGR